MGFVIDKADESLGSVSGTKAVFCCPRKIYVSDRAAGGLEGV